MTGLASEHASPLLALCVIDGNPPLPLLDKNHDRGHADGAHEQC